MTVNSNPASGFARVSCYWCGFHLFSLRTNDTATLASVTANQQNFVCEGCAKSRDLPFTPTPASAVELER